MEKPNRQNAQEVEIWDDLKGVAEKLLDFKSKGKSVFVNFNGHKLYSDEINSINDAFVEVMGMTQAEFETQREEMRKQYRKERLEAEKKAEMKIPEWIEKGKKFIYPERLDDWKYYVEHSARGFHNGTDIDNTLEIITMLSEDKSFEDIQKSLDKQGHSGSSFNMVTKNVLHFSKQGPDFYEQVVLKGKPDQESKKVLDQIRKENEKFAKRLEKDVPKELLSKLKGINKEELTERAFYEQVLSTVKEMRVTNSIMRDEKSFVKTLEDIGCLSYDEWIASKEANGEKIQEEPAVGDGIRSADISTAVSLVSNYMHNPSFMQSYMNDRTWDEEWLQSSMELYHNNTKAPYFQVAKQALMNWNSLSEEAAEKIIETQSFDEIESQVWAKSSMDYAIDSIKKSLQLSDEEQKNLSEFVFNGKDSEFIQWWKSRNEFIQGKDSVKTDKQEQNNNFIMDALFSVHDGWVKDNSKKFMARDKKHQHMPSELIGWKEAKADLLFIKPIFESVGIKVNETDLEQVYNSRVKEFFLEHGIENVRNLSDSITQGEEFYPALKGYGDILVTINDPDYVDKNIIPAIEQQGIGNIEEVRKNIVAQIISNPVPEDVARLSDEEKAQVEQYLGQEVSTLTAQRDELHQKNSIIQRIMALANRRKSIKKEISIEEQKKSENLHEFDD